MTAVVKPVEKLMFVYRARAGRVNALMDSAKKLLQINGCTLCSITHGLVGEKREWRSCRQEIGVPVVVFHRDELPSDLARTVGEDLPCVVAQVGGELSLLLDPETLDRCRGSVADLKARLKLRAAMHSWVIPGLE